MNKQAFWITSLLGLITVFVSACAPGLASAPAGPVITNLLTSPTPAVVRPTATIQDNQLPTTLPTATTDPVQARAEQAAQAAREYFDAVADGNSDAAAGKLSSFSLMVFQLTRGEAAEKLQDQYAGGQRWSDLQITGTQVVDEQTILLDVSYAEVQPAPAADKGGSTAATPTAQAAPGAVTVEAVWPMRQERGAWRYNWNNLVDFRTLDVKAQSTNNVTILPVQMNRYSDRIELIMLVQNQLNQVVVFGQNDETLGIFHFGQQQSVAEKTRWVFNPLRSIPDVTLIVKGYFETYPDSVEIRKWETINTAPWYVFTFEPAR